MKGSELFAGGAQFVITLGAFSLLNSYAANELD
jgi:hypothetical protein